MFGEDAQDQPIVEKRKQIDALRQEFRDAQQQHGRGLNQPQVPQRLHHYTTINGLLGITSNHSLWASDARFMNDALELSYATELIASAGPSWMLRRGARVALDQAGRRPKELKLLEDRRREQMLLATRQRMHELGVEMPEVQTAWGEANAEGIDMKFRMSSIGLIPYVELPLLERAGVFTGRLPLWQVVQGPSPTPELSLESLGM